MKRILVFIFALTLFVGANATDSATSAINMDSLKKEIVKNSKEIQEQVKDSAMFAKMTANQILELKKAELDVKREQIEAEGREDMPLSGFQIILIVLAPFIFVALVVYITIKSRNRESERRYNLYTKSLEMGQTIPEHFFNEPKKSSQNSNLKKGILWFVVGLAIFISFLITDKSGSLIFGIVPTFVGIGYLLVHFLDKPKTDTTESANEQQR